MKITIVNTSDIRGGAAIAASRLFKAIREKLPGTKMLVRDKLSNTVDITGLDSSLAQRFLNQVRFWLERFSYIVRAKNRNVWFDFSPANTGQDISRLPEVRSADIVHIHWVNGGFLSLRSLSKLLKTGKPVVWTMQDMWAYTGGCHYAGTCTNFMLDCGNCFYLKSPGQGDISSRILKKKRKIYKNGNLSFIASSNWMAENARKSSLIGNCRIEVLPNPINTDVFKPADKLAVRDELGLPRNKFLILSGAANLKDKRKGFIYLQEALNQLKRLRPESCDNFGLITFGKSSDIEISGIQVFPQSYLKDDGLIARLYQAADVYVIPTLEDNLPSTVMESLACGTPVVAFNTGGIPDMVDHLQSGYLAVPRDVNDLISGIDWVINHSDIKQVSEKCRNKVVENFSREVVAAKYIHFYESLLQ